MRRRGEDERRGKGVREEMWTERKRRGKKDRRVEEITWEQYTLM